MATALLARVSVSVSELKKSPSNALASGDGHPVAIMNHNKPTFYAVPARVWELMLDRLDDEELNRICDERADEVPVSVKLSDL